MAATAWVMMRSTRRPPVLEHRAAQQEGKCPGNDQMANSASVDFLKGPTREGAS